MEIHILRNGRIFDGTGRPSASADLVVADGRIASVGGPSISESGAEAVDLGGLAVAPGFIDTHTHSDVSLLAEPGCQSAIQQGVTTLTVGLCGYSAAPFRAEDPATTASEDILGYPGFKYGWPTIGGYLQEVRDAHPAANVVTFVGHNTIRRRVMGTAGRPATDAELAAMTNLLGSSLAEGAAGFSTGLGYSPGCFSTTDEVTALARVAAEHGKPYHTHLRVGPLTLRQGIIEAIETGRRSGVAVNISHLYPGVNDPPDEAKWILDRLTEARADGVKITCDVTLFRRGCGPWVQVLPAWARVGGSAAMVERLKDRSARAKLVRELTDPGPNQLVLNWDDALVVKVNNRASARFVGRSLGHIARDQGSDPLETALEMLNDDPQFWFGAISKRQDDLDQMLTSPLAVPVSDGMATGPSLYRDLGFLQTSFGAFPLFLGSYVREREILPLEQAIRRMSAQPAERLGLTDRGLLAPGYKADLVVFDPDLVANQATEAAPWTPPTGVDRVMVNGHWAVVGGRLTGNRSGSMLAV